jgi:hypothetical protein
MRKMQVGGKSDATGWGVYEESRKGGAIVATGHEHSYSRTHLLRSCQNQTVASQSNTLALARDDPDTPADEGRSFVFVSGLGGKSIRDQERFGEGWWASIYTSTQGATHGALFGEFNYQGDPDRARFYFKDIDGAVQDTFFVQASGESPPEPPPVEGELLIPARRLVIRNRLPDNESRNRIVFVSRGPGIAAATPGSAGDPRCGAGDGGELEIYSASSGQSLQAFLPCQNWTLLGKEQSPRGYRYLDREMDDGPCKVVMIRQAVPGQYVRARCLGRGPALLAYDLQVGQAQEPVRVRLTTGASVTYCTEFSADIRRDGSNGKIFLAGISDAPSGCPPPMP